MSRVTDLLMFTHRHMQQASKLTSEFASHSDNKQYTEAGVCWGKIVQTCDSVAQMDGLMRDALFHEAQDNTSTKE